jgi:hypothetical protein
MGRASVEEAAVSERENDHAGGDQEQRPAGGTEGPKEQELSQRRSRDRAREVQSDQAGEADQGDNPAGG